MTYRKVRMIRALIGVFYVIMVSSKVMADEFLEKSHFSSITEARPAWSWALALYNGQRTPSLYQGIIPDALNGRLILHDAHISSFVLSKHLFDIDIKLPFSEYRLNGFSFETEATINKHRGFQKNYEVSGALVIRSGEFSLGENMSMNVSWGNGLSYALAKPSWENGTSGLRGIDTPQLQYFMSHEVEFRHAAAQNISGFVRLHHRSGMYGVFSSGVGGTGSNYIGAGLRILFP